MTQITTTTVKSRRITVCHRNSTKHHNFNIAMHITDAWLQNSSDVKIQILHFSENRMAFENVENDFSPFLDVESLTGSERGTCSQTINKSKLSILWSLTRFVTSTTHVLISNRRFTNSVGIMTSVYGLDLRTDRFSSSENNSSIIIASNYSQQ